MHKRTNDKGIRIMCAVMFLAFAFCWTYFIQAGVLEVEYGKIVDKTNILVPYNRLAMSIVVVLVSWFWVLILRKLLNFKNGLYACNYLLSAAFLGFVTSRGQSVKIWLMVAALAVLLIVICKIVSKVPKSDIAERGISGGILIMTLLFCMTAFLGNTDENYHRQLLIERYLNAGDYAKALQIGRFEEESNEAIDLLRAKALIATGQLGDELFEYSICNPSVLADSLAAIGDEAGLMSLLLAGDVMSIGDTIDYVAFENLPRYYMQALILAGDQQVQDIYPEAYAQASTLYGEFMDVLESVSDSPKQHQANATFLNFHTSYYWFYYFKVEE